MLLFIGRKQLAYLWFVEQEYDVFYLISKLFCHNITYCNCVKCIANAWTVLKIIALDIFM